MTNEMCIRDRRVLVQGYNEKQTMLWGKTEGNMNCEFEGDDSLIGTFVDVKITESPNFVLKGDVYKRQM